MCWHLDKHICLLFLTFQILIHSRPQLDTDFTNNNCYESFTYPRRFLELSHFSSVGPPYLFVILYYNLSTNNNQSVWRREEYNFKRTKESCSSLFLFTTEGIIFREMNIGIYMYSYKSYDMIAEMFYTFCNNFIPGVYVFRDKNINFAVPIEIVKTGKQRIENLTKLHNSEKNYLNSLKQNINSLCVITRNAGVLVLNPIYDNAIPNGLIINVNFEYRSDYTSEAFVHTAFECPSEKNEHQDSIIIVDQFLSEEIIFVAVYLAYDQDELLTLEVPFTMESIHRVEVKQSLNLPQNIKKLFLIQDIRDLTTCPDDTERILFKSEYGVTYYAVEIKKVEVALDAFELQWITHSPLEPCGT